MIKNAFLSVRKNIGKSILVFVIMTVIANLVMAGLSIKEATTKSMNQVRQSLGSEVTLSYNTSKLMELRKSGESIDSITTSITTTMADQLKSLEYVKHYNYTLSVTADSDDIKPISTTTDQSDDRLNDVLEDIQNSSDQDYKKGINEAQKGNRPQLPGDFLPKAPSSSFDISQFKDRIQGALKNMDSSDFTVVGNTTMEYLESFTNNNYILSEGRLLTAKDNEKVCVIEKTLASDNNLKLGDSFKVSYTDNNNQTNSVTLKIVGTYEIKSTVLVGGRMSNRQSPYNTIYVPLNVSQILNGDTKNITSASYYLDDPAHIESFKTSATKTSIDFETYTLDANDHVYQRSIHSLENMSSFANIFLWIVIGAGSIILCLILILTLRSRFYEFGVLLSLGQSKIKIIVQQLIEIGLIAAIAFTLSLGTGKLVSNAVSSMISTSTTETVTNDTRGKSMLNPVLTNPTKELDVSITSETILKLAGITGVICVVSVLLPSVYVLRLSPREILVKKEG